MEVGKKKVLFFICASHPNAGGGHFYSLKALMEALNEVVNAKVVNIGLTKVSTLPQQKLLGFVPIFKYSIFSHFHKLLKIAKEFQPDVLHAFDERSLYVAKCISLFINYRVPIVYTKCGGVNGGRFIPAADASVFFSAENVKHYLTHRRFKKAYYLIPNRSLPVQQDIERQDKLKNLLGHFAGVTLLRISRFNRYYELTFQQSLQLLKDFSSAGFQGRLILLGKVQDEDFFQELKESITSSNILFVTDEHFTRNASELLGIADVVIGTGRGVMEAASLSKPVYCPNGASVRPVLLKEERINALLNKNFSERYLEKDAKIEISTDGVESEKAFTELFDIRNVVGQYESIYNDTRKERGGIVDFIVSSLWFFRP
ncbi:MAG: hypothetical protein AB8H12_19220 [Lewinella sp.]